MTGIAVAPSATDTGVHHIHFPNESAAYRAARNDLLAEEMELRRQISVDARLQRKPLSPHHALALHGGLGGSQFLAGLTELG